MGLISRQIIVSHKTFNKTDQIEPEKKQISESKTGGGIHKKKKTGRIIREVEGKQEHKVPEKSRLKKELKGMRDHLCQCRSGFKKITTGIGLWNLATRRPSAASASTATVQWWKKSKIAES